MQKKIENLLREDLVDFHAFMAKIVTRQDLLNAYYTKYIIWNLKVILKGKAMGRTYEEILPMLTCVRKSLSVEEI